MIEANKVVAELLFKAITAEHDGEHFYRMAADRTEDEQAQQVFRRLADEERGHQEFLRAQHKAVSQTGQIDSRIKLGIPSDLSSASPIFSEEFKGRIKDAHFEMSSLSIAIHLEKSAMAYYAECARTVEDPAVQRFFEELTQWETGHYRALLRQQDMLKDDFWSEAGFSPY
ncbi:MAG: ferritin family protein [Pseudomonadota bacterium]